MKRNLNSEALNYCSLFWIFITAGFIGVFVENIWCIIVENKIEFRSGIIYGPFNPVYGFGAVLMTIILYQLNEKRDLIIFIVCALTGAIFEYLCSVFQELAFGTISWDYSNTQLNFGGRTNLVLAVLWGLLGFVWIKSLLPRISNTIKEVPRRILVPLTIIGTIFIVFSICISYMAIGRQSERRDGIIANNILREFLDNNYSDEILKRLYPNMTTK